MARTVISNPARVLAFVNQHQKLAAVAGMKGIGLEEDGELIAGVVYEGFNGANIWMHVAAVPGKRWLTREYLRVCFDYPFNQLGVARVSGYVNETNMAARRFDEHLGFTLEATLEGASADGKNVMIYKMLKANCRHV